MEEIGIHIRAKAHLEEMINATQEFNRFGQASDIVKRKILALVESQQKWAETDINKLAKDIGNLQKKIDDPSLTQKQRKQINAEITGIQEKIKELKQLQRVKADDFGSLEQEARLGLEILKNKKNLTRAEKEYIKELEDGLKYLEQYNKAQLELESVRLGKIKKDWKEQEERAAKAGLGEIGARGGRFVRRAAGLIIGGTLIGVAIQSMKRWADVDTAITRTSASLDGLDKQQVMVFTEMANLFGYTKIQALEYLDVITQISGKMSETEITGYTRLLGYGRAMGVGAQALQMREIQRWGGEGITMGGQRGNVFLTQFTEMARLLNMREGRMGEFIDVGINLTKTMERTFLNIENQDILRNIMLPAMMWGGADRGRGMRGFSFMQRIQGALANPNDIMNLMLYRTIGVPTTYEQMWKLRGIREKGVWGTYEDKPLLTGIIDQFSNLFGGKFRAMMMMKAAMPEMSVVEITEMFKRREKIRAGKEEMEVGEISKELRDKLIEAGIDAEHIKADKIIKINEDYFEILTSMFPELVRKSWTAEGMKFVAAGERWKVAIENMQVSIGGTFGLSVISLLTGLANAVDKIASRVVPDYVSQAGMMGDFATKYATAYDLAIGKNLESGRDLYERAKKELIRAKDLKLDEPGYLTPEQKKERQDTIIEYERLRESQYGKMLIEMQNLQKKTIQAQKSEQDIVKESYLSDQDDARLAYYRRIKSEKEKKYQEVTDELETGDLSRLKYSYKEALAIGLSADIARFETSIQELGEEAKSLETFHNNMRSFVQTRVQELEQKADAKEVREFRANKLIINNIEGLSGLQPNIIHHHYQQITVEPDELRYIEKHPETGEVITIGETDNE